MCDYSLDDARRDMEIVRERCGYADPTAAVAFADIATRLMRDMSIDDFEKQVPLVEFIFTEIFCLRDWVFDTSYVPSEKTAHDIFQSFESGLRAYLMKCNGIDKYFPPKNVDGKCVWRLFHNEFLPVIDAIRSSKDAVNDLNLF